MPELSIKEQEVALLIIETLKLEDITPENIDPNAALFNEGLGLDSIDALELSLAISMKYGFQIKSNDADIIDIFSSLKALAKYIEQRCNK